MKRPVVKLKPAAHEFLTLGMHDGYFVGRQHSSEQTELYQHLGPVTLSVKCGKSRKLVKGTLDAFPDSNQYTGLSWEYVFKPANAEQDAKFRRLTGV